MLSGGNPQLRYRKWRPTRPSHRTQGNGDGDRLSEVEAQRHEEPRHEILAGRPPGDEEIQVPRDVGGIGYRHRVEGAAALHRLEDEKARALVRIHRRPDDGDADRIGEDDQSGQDVDEAGAATADVCRKHGISSATFYKWKAKYGGLEVSEARRLKALEDENRRLKKLLAEAMLDNAMLKDIAAKKW